MVKASITSGLSGHRGGRRGPIACPDDPTAMIGRMGRSADVPYRLTVLGTGYLGTTHAARMADLGFEVRGLAVAEGKLARLQAGDLPIRARGWDERPRRKPE